jgi:hypothetical protein
MSLGLGASLSKTGLTTPGIITDNLAIKHNYSAGAVVPVSDGAYLGGGDGTNDRITISSTAFSVHDTPHSFAFWAKRNVTNATHAVFGNHANGGTHGGAYSHIIFLSTNGYLQLETDVDGDRIEGVVHTVDTNWHHYAITIGDSGASAAIYQDGVSLTVQGDSTIALDNDITLDLIGATNNTGSSYEIDGYLCNLGIWDAKLTQPQVKSIMWKSYADLTSTESEDLIHWWALDEGEGITANDSKGSLNGTVVI